MSQILDKAIVESLQNSIELLDYPATLVGTFEDAPADYEAPYFELSFSSGDIVFTNGSAKDVKFNVDLTYCEDKPLDENYIGASPTDRLLMAESFVFNAIVKLTSLIEMMKDKRGDNPLGMNIKLLTNEIPFTKVTDKHGKTENKVWSVSTNFTILVNYDLCLACSST